MNLRGWKKFDLKAKTAAAVTVMNIILTSAKFLLYYFSGSMAILAEAWHSFSDIATSILVLIAVSKSSLTSPETESGKGIDDSRGNPKNLSNRMEWITSLGIGLLLTIVAVSLIGKFIQSESKPIENSLLSGSLSREF